MKTLPILLVLTPAAALAASPFDGTWMERAGSYHNSGKPYVLIVDQNEYRCENCGSPMSVKPDGQFHEVTGHAYDSASAKIVNGRTVQVRERKSGKILEEYTLVASPDRKQLRAKIVDRMGEKPITAYVLFVRSSGTGPEEDKNAVSGSWVVTSQRQNHVPIMLKMTEDGFSWSANGQHYQAKFDGAPVAIEGDPTHTMASVKKLSENEVQETDTVDGRPVDQTVFAASPDGKSIKVTDTDPRAGHQADWVLDRQK